MGDVSCNDREEGDKGGNDVDDEDGIDLNV